MKLIFLLICIISFHKAFAQQTYSKLNVNLLGLPNESTEKVLYTDASGKVRSSAVSKTTLDYLDVTSSIQDQLDLNAVNIQTVSDDLAALDGVTVKTSGAQSIADIKTFTSSPIIPTATALSNDTKAASTAYTDGAITTHDATNVHLTGNESIAGTKTFTGKFVASSTTNAFKPCPLMNSTQRDALTPTQSDCVYNTTTDAVEFRNGASAWASTSVPTTVVKVTGVTNPIWFGAAMSSAGSITGNFGGSIITAGSCSSGSHSATFTGLPSAPQVCVVQITSAVANIFAVQGLAWTSTTLTFTIRNDGGAGTCRNVHIACLAASP